MPEPARILVVANRTAATPALIEAVRERARKGPCSFALLVPQLACEVAYGDEEARTTLELAIPLLEQAAGGTVTPMIGPADAFLAVERALVHERFDEVIISTLPERVSQWLGATFPPGSRGSSCPSRSCGRRRRGARCTSRRSTRDPERPARWGYSQPARLNDRCSASP